MDVAAAVKYIYIQQLHKFKNLSTSNKLKIMKATVIPSLIYPTVPLNTLTDNQFRRLQTVYNKAIRIVTNTSALDMITSRSLHRRLKIKPVNSIIHKQATEIWRKIHDTQQEIYNSLRYPHPRRYHIHLPSSRTIAEGPTPRPRHAPSDPPSRPGRR